MVSFALWLLMSASGAGAVPVRVSSEPVTGLELVDVLYFSRHEKDNLSRSHKILEEMIDSKPRDAAVFWRYGRSLIRMGEKENVRKDKIALFTRAENMLERSTKIEPDNAEAHFWRGLALGRRGEARGILRSLFMIGPLKRRMRRVLELDPGHGGAHHVLGRMFFELPGFVGGSNKKAVRELETARRLSPDFTAHYPALAEVYLDMGKKERARKVLKAFYDVKSPSDPAVYDQHREEVEKLLSGL